MARPVVTAVIAALLVAGGAFAQAKFGAPFLRRMDARRTTTTCTASDIVVADLHFVFPPVDAEVDAVGGKPGRVLTVEIACNKLATAATGAVVVGGMADWPAGYALPLSMTVKT